MTPTFFKLLLLTCLFSGSYESVNAASPTFHPVKAKLVQPRSGIANTLLKLKQNQEVRVAYLGGSITAAPGWRVKTTLWLQETYPQSKIHEIHTVTVEIHPEQPNRSSVAFRLKNPELELQAPKFQGTKIRVGKIMLRGELVP